MKLKALIIILAVVLACLLAYIPFLPEIHTAPDTEGSSAVPIKPSSSVNATVSSQSSVPSTTQPVVTEPPTQPPVKEYSDNPTANAFIQARLATWICPVKDAFGEVVGSRTFASSRGGGTRAHAGLDFVAPHGTKVYAITSGTVQRVAVFYKNTYAVEVKNDDGSILRYCEIATNLQVGDRVEQGNVIGTILRADGGTEMLHMEVYLGDGDGALTQKDNTIYKYVDASKKFLRRSDLIDPTFLKDLPQ